MSRSLLERISFVVVFLSNTVANVVYFIFPIVIVAQAIPLMFNI